MTDLTCSPLIIEKMLKSHGACFADGKPKNPDDDDFPVDAGCAAEFSRLANCCTNAMGTETEKLASMNEAEKNKHMKSVLDACPANAE